MGNSNVISTLQQNAALPAADPHPIHNIKKELREMIQERRRTTRKPLSTIFNHFDRRNCGNFDGRDLSEALFDLRLPNDGESCAELVSAMAINSRNKNRVSFAEFSVFLDDPDHEQFFSSFCASVARQRVASFFEVSAASITSMARITTNRSPVASCCSRPGPF